MRRLLEDYRLSWGIESGYGGIETYRARTMSGNYSLRLLYLFCSLILCNIWLSADLILARRFAKMLGKPIIPMRIVKVLRAIAESYPRQRVTKHIPIWTQSYLMKGVKT